MLVPDVIYVCDRYVCIKVREGVREKEREREREAPSPAQRASRLSSSLAFIHT